jgi:hypothetical protein
MTTKGFSPGRASAYKSIEASMNINFLTAKAKKAKKEKQKGLDIKNLFACEPLVRVREPSVRRG